MMSPSQPSDVESEPWSFWPERLLPPRYDFALDWMTATEGRAVSLDIWARGNYTRRLIHHHQTGTVPLVVPIRSVEQMRWAYRRLGETGK